MKSSHYDNTDKLHFETDVKKNDCYNCERSDHFTKNCRSFLKNLNYIKINAVKTKKRQSLINCTSAMKIRSEIIKKSSIVMKD